MIAKTFDTISVLKVFVIMIAGRYAAQPIVLK